jgi:surface polysaccharide O-acyltransferase-like enzyme
MKQYTLINRALAGVAFLITLITYMLTLQPSVPFWDCGEFSAATAWQQVPHPPGAPLFLIVARLFHMIPIGDPGWRINMVSAVSSAVTAALVYLIIVKIIERWRPFREGGSVTNYLATFGGGLIGTLAFTWSDTQWFNSVESEVYAGGTMLIALLIWLMMRWNEKADKPGHERYLLLIAYIVGLAFGIHLLALLVVPGVAMVIYFRTRRFTPLSAAVALLITGVGFYALVYRAPLNWIPKLIANSGIGVGLLVVAALGAVMWYGIKTKNGMISLASGSMLMILLGFTTYTHILMRSNAHPAMNENEPDTITELVAYLGRDQYGYAPNWPRRYQEDGYYRQRQDRYGEWFPPTRRDKDNRPIFDKVNTGGELKFMWQYQTYHMYLRYLFWNFVGRVSDVQNAGVAFASVSETEKSQFIQPTGYTDVFPIKFFALPLLLGLIGMYYHYRRDWKMALVFTSLFLLLGIIATWQQNQQEPQPRERDYFYVGSFMIFAMWIGIGATGLAEKIGIVHREVEDGDSPPILETKTGVMAAVLAVGMVVAPFNMALGGWASHNRAGNWVPWDYSYNILQSVEKDAIVFTNGDNDTFPVWYLQDVAGVRRDVRIVNLSLGQTSWYIWQLKHERPWGSKTVPISFSDQMLKIPEGTQGGLGPELMKPQTVVSIPVPQSVMRWAIGRDTTEGTMSWEFQGGDYGGQQGSLLGVQHKLVRDILTTNKWERPVYFSTSTGSDVWCGLSRYFRQEGMAYRIMPVEQGTPRSPEALNVEVMRKCLMESLPDDKSYNEPHYGFKMRNLANPSVYFNEDARRLMINYRTMYLSLAGYELNVGKDPKRAVATLDMLEKMISPDMFGLPYPLAAEIANIYKQAGAADRAAKYATRAIKDAEALGDDPEMNPYAQNYPPTYIKAQMYAIAGEYDKAIQLAAQIQQQYPGDYRARAQMESFRIDKYLDKKDTAGAVTEIGKIITSYGADSSAGAQGNIQAYRSRISELKGILTADTAAKGGVSGGGATDSSTRSGDSGR